MELASLAIQIDSTSAKAAATDLDRLTSTGRRTEEAMDGVGRGGRSAGEGSRDAASGSNRARQAMDQQNQSARSLTATIRQYALIAAGAFSANALVQYADAWSDMQSRIGAATRSMESAPALMRRMVDIANASYAPLQQTVEIYSRNVAVLRDMGRSASEAADFTEALNHMLVITATKGQQAASVQDALAKAMATGRLQADGLETVLANGGRVAEALAWQLGTTVSGLRDMASQGKITSDVIANALLGSLESVRVESGEMAATVSDAFTRMQTNISEFIGRIDQASGVSSSLADRIMAMADGVRTAGDYVIRFGQLAAPAFDMVGSAVSSVAQYADVAVVALAGFYAPAMLGGVAMLTTALATGLVGALKAVAAAMWANPLGLFIGFIATAGYALYRFRDQISEVIGTDVINLFKGAANFVIGSFVAAYDDIKFVWDNFGPMMGNAVIGGVNHAIRAINSLIQTALTGVNTLIDAINKIPGVDIDAIGGSLGIREIANPFSSHMEAAFADRQRRLQESLSRDYVGEAADAMRSALSKLTPVVENDAEAHDARSKALATAAAATGAAVAAAEDMTATLRGEWLTSLDDQIEALHTQNFALQDQIAHYGLAESEVMRLAAAEADEAASALSAARAKAILNGATAESIAQYDEEIARLRDLSAARRLVAGSMARVEMQQAQDEYLKEWERTNEQIGQSLTDALMRGFEDGQSFAENFRRTLVNMFQTLVLRPIIQPIVTQAAGAVTGSLGLGGGGMGGLGMPGGFSSLFGNSIGSGISQTAYNLFSTPVSAAAGGVGPAAPGALSGMFSNAGSYSNLAYGAAGLAGGLGANLLFRGEGQSSMGGSLGTMAGMAMGGPLGAVAGALLGGGLGSLFGGWEGETRYGAGYMVDPVTGRATLTGGPSGGDSNASQAITAIEGVYQTTDRLAQLLGGSVAGMSFGAGSELSPEKGNSFVWSSWARDAADVSHITGMRSLEGVTDGNVVAAEFAVELQRSIIRGLQMANVDEHWAEWINQFDVSTMGDADVQSVVAMIEALTRLRSVATDMGMESLANATAQAQANLIGLSGGIDAFSTNLQTYYEGFYTEGERAANLTDSLTRGLAEFGLELPNTRAEYRALVEAQDLATESGQRAYAALLGMSGAFAQLVAAAEESTADLEAVARERESLELRWLQLTGNTAELRRRELAALDASNRAQQERIWALEDEIALREAAARSAEQWASSMQAAQTNAEQFHAGFTRSIGDYLAQLRGTDAGLRSPQDQLAAAQADYAIQLAMARAGDRDALSGITQYADRLIQAGTGMYASGEGAQSIIDRIERDLAALPEQVTIEELMLEELRGIRAGVLEGDAALQAALEAGNASDIAAALAPHFGMLDASLDGLLSYGELSEALAGKATDAQIATLFAMSDLNFDGGISRLELALGGVRHDLTQILPSDLAALLEQSFASIDLDTSGLLTSAELQAALGGAATSADVQGIMSYLDINMDGLISRQELANNGITNLRAEMGNMIAVMDAYSSVLGRAPEPGGFYYWMDELRAGNVTTDQLAEVIAWAAQQPGGELGGGATTPGGGTVNPGTGAGGGGTTPTTPGLTASQRTAKSWYTDIAGWSNPGMSDINYWAAIIDAQGASQARRHWAYQMGIQYHNGVKLYARGGLAMPGWAIVGEEGPELVNFSQPGRVYTAQQTAKMLEPPTRAGGHGQGDTQVREELRRLQSLVAAQTDLIDKMLRHQAAVAPRVIAAGERTADATEQQARRAAKQEAIPT